ncbi:matrixin family metalloprotease [Vulgatibacter sp.]|uniref:matrixin family metalloprotease n=1 Tax=Vulgatibacter sp. TaxID=1971226 RepID=UPI003566ED0A
MSAGRYRWLLSLVTLALLAAPFPAAAYAFIFEGGCAPNHGAAWNLLNGPSRWYLEQSGYAGMPVADVETVLEDAMDTWAAPCCSAFQHQYLGTTTTSAMEQNAANVVEFEDGSWPREFGAVTSTIAVTIPVAMSNCTLVQADMVFNAVGFTFRNDGRVTDLQSIATHEFGHWLGLDHTNATGGTMLPYYSNGTAERTLTQDDIDGVCALYPASCGGCTGDGDCITGEICDAGTCVAQPCTDSAECSAGAFCWKGSCTPGCKADGECDAGQVCNDGSCIRDPATCSICATCASSADCGGDAYLCVDLDGSGVGACTRTCASNADCDGDSFCRTFTDGSQFCFAPSTTALCPDEYVCDAAGAPSCPGLWDRCLTDDHCGSGICARTENGNRCTCDCAVDADCGLDARCMDDGAGGTMCVPTSAIDPCDGVSCAEPLICTEGACVDPCDGVTCPEGWSCAGGACISPCGDCEAGTTCDVETRNCVPADPCAGIDCAEGERCVEGACVPGDPCDGVSCGATERCEAGACVPLDGEACGDRICGTGERCVDGSCRLAAGCGGGCPTGSQCVDGTCAPAPGSGGGDGGDGCAAAAGTGPSGLALAGIALAAWRRRRLG